jgi:uncharacterized protein YdeI (YjbR/CyaY-like superfamily)
MPTPHDVAFFETAAELRAWFEINHDKADELWVGYHRKRSGRASVTWKDVVDQCLCFGWIDSVRYPFGAESSAQRVTPRRSRSIWSDINIRRFGELQREGLVRAKGRAAFERREEARSRLYSYENRGLGLDPTREAAFRRHAAAWRYFEAQPPSYRVTAAYWVMSAKREETRKRRLDKLIDYSKNGERIPPFGRPSPRSS